MKRFDPFNVLSIGCITLLVVVCLLPLALFGWSLSHFLEAEDRPAAVDAERTALQRLSRDLRARPAAPIRLDFIHDGSKFGGIVSHQLVYDPTRHSFRDWSESAQELWFELAAVEPDQIHQVANSGGSYNELARQKGVRLLFENPGRAKYGTPLRKKPLSKGTTRRRSND